MGTGEWLRDVEIGLRTEGNCDGIAASVGIGGVPNPAGGASLPLLRTHIPIRWPAVRTGGSRNSSRSSINSGMGSVGASGTM